MSFEEWLEPLHRMRCCNNEHYTDDDLRSAYEARLHADVHTDNSKVIAKLEAQIETKDIQIKDLQEQKYYWKESSFDWRHKFFKKGRIKQLIEKEKRIKELEKENAELNNRNQELLESCEGATMMYKQLIKAKEIIKDLMSFSVQLFDCRHTVDFEKTREQAEQYLKE